MADKLDEIKKGISDIKLSVIISVLIAFFVGSVFAFGIFNSKLNDILIIVNEIDDKSLDYRQLAN